MNKPLRGAIVGFGQVAQAGHEPAFRGRDNFHILAVCDPSGERRALAARSFPEALMYSSYEELLSRENELDFVDIATPPACHGKQVLQALDHGLHVLCEKPLTTVREEYDAIVRHAAAAGRCVYTAHNWAYAPIWAKAWTLLGELGKVTHAELRVLRAQPAASAMPGDWRRDPKVAGGGILVDHGWHNLYLLRRLLGGTVASAEAAEASCALSYPDGSETEDSAAVLFRFPKATGFLNMTWRASERSNIAFACGERGTLEINDDLLLLRTTSGPERRFPFSEKLSAGSAHPEWFSAMLPDFERELRDPSVRGRNLDEAGFVADLLNKAYLASRTEALA